MGVWLDITFEDEVIWILDLPLSGWRSRFRSVSFSYREGSKKYPSNYFVLAWNHFLGNWVPTLHPMEEILDKSKNLWKGMLFVDPPHVVGGFVSTVSRPAMEKLVNPG